MRTLHSPVPVDGWTKWFLFSVDFSGLNDVDVLFSDKTRTGLVLSNRQGLKIKYPDPIPYLLGSNRSPVYSESPTLKLPDDGSGTWSQQILYVGPGQAPEDIYGEHVDFPVGEELPIFPESDDAWVGRYEVRLFKNHRFVDSWLINIAEGMKLRVNYSEQASGISFRRDNVHLLSHGLTLATYQFDNPGKKPIIFDQGNKAVAANSIEAIDTIYTPQNFELECFIVPDRLTFRLDRVDTASTWRSFAEELNFEDLDPHGELSVRIPAKVKGVELTLVRKEGQKILTSMPLASRGINTWYLPAHVLLDKIPTGSTVLMALRWQYPFSEGELWRQHNNRSTSKRDSLNIHREIEYQRKRAEDGHHADLGSIRREPLVSTAIFSEGTVRLRTRFPARD